MTILRELDNDNAFGSIFGQVRGTGAAKLEEHTLLFGGSRRTLKAVLTNADESWKISIYLKRVANYEYWYEGDTLNSDAHKVFVELGKPDFKFDWRPECLFNMQEQEELSAWIQDICKFELPKFRH